MLLVIQPNGAELSVAPGRATVYLDGEKQADVIEANVKNGYILIKKSSLFYIPEKERKTGLVEVILPNGKVIRSGIR